MSRPLSIICRQLYRHRPAALRSARMARLSLSSSLHTDPSKLVSGLTREKLEADPSLLDFLKVNYPEAFEQQQQQKDTVMADAVEEEEESPAKEQTEPAAATMTGDSKLNIRSLTCYLRDTAIEEGSRSCKRLRDERMIPGLLYGGDPTQGIFSHQPESKIFIKTPWNQLQRELDRYHRSFESRVYDLTVLTSPDDDSGGTVHRVVPKNVQRHPVKDTIYCANFLRYHPGRPIKIPIAYINEEESSALKRDGFILPLQRFVECFVEDGAPIPENIQLECTDLQFKEVIRVDRLLLPDGVRFSDRVIKRGDEFLVGVVHGKSRDPDEGADEEVAAEE